MIEDFIYPVVSKYKDFLLKVFFILFLIVCNSCTYNPIFPIKKTQQTQITGTIAFDDNLTPEKVFVWMEEFNLFTYTEEDGAFQLTLSQAESQGIDGGISGNFAIYFYHPNYIIDSLRVKLVNGKIAKNQTNVDDNGDFKSDIILQKFFSHFVSIDSIGTLEEYPGKSVYDSLRVTVKLHAYKQNVTVKTRIWNKPYLITTLLRRTGVMFYSILLDHRYDYLDINSLFYEYIIPAGTEVTWDEYILPFYEGNFYSSDYQVIPFILPEQELPTAMLYCMGKNKFDFHPEYLELPLQRNECLISINGTLDDL